MTDSLHFLRTHPTAEAELIDAATSYERTRPGHGRLFLDEVAFTIELARQWPLMYAEIDPGIRRAPLRRFPFNLYFLIQAENDELHLLACLPGRGDPATLLELLASRMH